MKKDFIYIISAAALLLSCTKEPVRPDVPATPEDEITFTTGEDAPMVIAFDETKAQTKAATVTTLSSFKVAATYIESGTEKSKWNDVTFSGSTDFRGTPAQFWPGETDQHWLFYAANAPLHFAASGTYIDATAGTDYVVAYKPSVTWGAKNELTFNHIYGRVGNVSVSVSDAAVTVSSCVIKVASPKLSGTYNIKTGAWTASASSPVDLYNAPADATNRNADLWLVPGTYELTCEWTETRGSSTKNRSAGGASITVEAGRVKTVSALIVAENGEILFTIGDYVAWDHDYPVNEES